jgi:hypothetical protein
MRHGSVLGGRGRCRKGVDHGSDESPKLIPVDDQPKHKIVHALRLGEAQRAADESLDPGPQIDRLALAFLRVLLPYLRGCFKILAEVTRWS